MGMNAEGADVDIHRLERWPSPSPPSAYTKEPLKDSQPEKRSSEMRDHLDELIRRSGRK